MRNKLYHKDINRTIILNGEIGKHLDKQNESH